MKHKLGFLIIISILSIQAIHSQLSIGFKGGYTNSFQEYGDVDLPQDAEIDVEGFNIGMLINYDLNNSFALEVSPAFVRRGAACMPGFINFSGDSDLLLSYAELPVYLAFKYPFMKNRITPFVKLGYSGNILLKAEEKIEVNFINDPSFNFTDITDNNTIRKIDHGIALGAGLNINAGLNTFVISIEHYRGFPDAEKLNTSKNRSLSYNFGIMQRI
ncbi:outer membrane beta-barrel protein [Portibacter lacus]|uniref:Outer membrane protein beta-barrel domain-containing protein n=1 Tax=Portibacter lacus TaxID=1099794 RepID=A0AA37WDZ6_9BACT|nr:outer membrane beta-barrel protein [Portibacter lacus]GLR18386.1 hypothetical protein GCM10007940_30020 [Portibacter lacus]